MIMEAAFGDEDAEEDQYGTDSKCGSERFSKEGFGYDESDDWVNVGEDAGFVGCDIFDSESM